MLQQAGWACETIETDTRTERASVGDQERLDSHAGAVVFHQPARLHNHCDVFFVL